MATDYEKKYKEALERAKRLTSDMTTLQKIREFIFPELVESEDERIRKNLKDFLRRIANGEMNDRGTMPSAEKCQKWIAYLEKQKEQKPVDLSDMMVHKEPYIAPVPTPMVADEQKPTEWSEEDEDNLCRVIRVLEDNDSDWKELSNWLKSLRPSWKPSEEQMRALNEIVNILAESPFLHQNDYLFNILNGLREELKKLL